MVVVLLVVEVVELVVVVGRALTWDEARVVDRDDVAG